MRGNGSHEVQALVASAVFVVVLEFIVLAMLMRGLG